MDVREIVEKMGGTLKVASLCGVTQSAVSQWVSANKIPRAREMYLRLKRPKAFLASKESEVTEV